jgi:glycosidase
MLRGYRGLLAAWVIAAAACATTAPQHTAPTAAAAFPGRDAIYEVFVRDFSPAGNFAGVTANLDRIAATGINVVWLMPIHPVGVLNRKGPLGSSYSATDYRAINPDYGTATDFRALVDAVHARGMKLILDWVPNHTAWDHVWVKSHPARYTRTASGEMSPPMDNEGKVTDWTDVADLNYSNPDLRQAMIADMRYWLETYGIDGYRVDVAGFVPDDFWREALPQLRSAARKPILLLAEWGDLRMHTLGYDLSYGWDGYGRLKAAWKGGPASAFIEGEIADLRAMPAGGERLRFTTNHDETAWDVPPPTLFGGVAGARAAFVAMALLPGTPMLYNGQEVESPQKLGLFVKEPVNWDQPNAADARAFYRRVIDLARTHPAFAGNDLTAVQTSADADVIAYRRGNVVVLSNTRPRPVSVSVSGVAVAGARDLLSGTVQSGAAVSLPAHGAVVLELAAR